MADLADISSTDVDETRLAGFLDELRAVGFNIGVDQYIQASKLLIWMSQEENTDISHEVRMQSLLAPLLCKTEDQQRRFPLLFSNWVGRQEDSSTPLNDASVVPFETAKSGPVRWKIAASFFILLAVFVTGYFLPKPGLQTASNQTSTATKSDTSPAESTQDIDDLFGETSTDNAATAQADSKTETRPVPNSTTQQSTSQKPVPDVGGLGKEVPTQKGKQTTPDRNEEGSSDSGKVDSPQKPVGQKKLPGKDTEASEKIVTQPDWMQRDKKQPDWNPSSSPWPLVVLWFLPALAGFTWLLSDWIAFAMTARFLTRKRVAQNQAITTSELSAGIDPHGTLFSSLDFARAAQIFRRHNVFNCDTLDVNATAIATAKNTGIFTPVMTRRHQTPAYIALIGRDSPDDHQAAIAEEFLQLLQENGITCTRYFFDDDARFCFESESKKLVRLSELAALHADDRLLVLANSETLIDPVNGGIVTWAHQFDPWKEAAFFAFPGNDDRNAFKRTLAERFHVVPALPSGFETVADVYLAQTSNAFASFEDSKDERYPSLLQHDPYRWQEDYAPERDECDLLVGQLNAYLGSEGFRWLCACAVYPEVTWRITVYLGKALEQQRKIVLCQTNLHALARLPWFRNGAMPNWLRVELLSRFGKSDQRFVRKVLTEFLISGATNRDARSIKTSNWSDGFAKRVLRQMFSSWNRRANQAVGTRDVVFRSFMFSPLAMQLPAELSRKLMSSPVRFSVVRLIVFLVGCFVAAVGMRLFNPYSSNSLESAIVYKDRDKRLPPVVVTNDTKTLPPDWEDHYGPVTAKSQWIGSTGCATTACHGNPNEPTASWQNSALNWRSRDPHSTAGDILRSEDSKRIVMALAPDSKTEGEVDAFLRKRCISCHLSATAEDVASTLPLDAGRVHEGVSCESCHGPARSWLEKHSLASWTGPTRFDPTGGMRNTESLIERTEDCMRCHVGSRTADGIVRDVNHDLIAAGHPSLQFDMLTYQDKMPHHWNDDSAVEAEFSRTPLKTHLVGNFLGLSIAARLASERAKQSLVSATSDSGGVPWPELSEFNCSACHQDLTARAYRLPKTMDGEPSVQISDGLPLWNAWYTASIAGNGDTALWKLWPKAGTQLSWIDSAENWQGFSRLEANSYVDSHSDKSCLFTINEFRTNLIKRAPSDWNEAAAIYRVLTAAARELVLQVDTEEFGGQLLRVLREQIEPLVLVPPGFVEPENFDPREFRDVTIKALEDIPSPTQGVSEVDRTQFSNAPTMKGD